MTTSAAHALPVEEVLKGLSADVDGLDSVEAARRLRQVGRNRLDVARSDSALTIFFNQFKSVVVLLLLATASIAAATGENLEAIAIGAVLLLNSTIGFVTEYRARRAMAALLALDVPRAVVLRDGELATMDAQLVVPGDVVMLIRGQHIPADGRVMSASDLRTDEAALTGESVFVSKSSGALPTNTPLADRRNMVYKGSLVAAGTGRAVVTSTGMQTEVGRIGRMTAAIRAQPTPLERRLDDLARRLVWLALGVGALVAILERLQGGPFVLVVQTGMALAIAAVPEALPAVATIALAVGVKRMAARHALVRRLTAVESLGSTTVICTDKTRTLTSGEMSAVSLWTEGKEFALGDAAGARSLDVRLVNALEVAALASRPQSHHPDGATGGSDPVDAALLHAARAHGVDRSRLECERPAVGLLPFASERKLMAAFHHVGDETVAYVKGAPHTLLALSTRTSDGRWIDDSYRAKLETVNARLAGNGQRVLGLAEGAVSGADESALTDLVFVGLIGLIDPPAPGVKDTIAQLQQAGLRIVMLTGDQQLTAEAIGRDIGLLPVGARVVGAKELDGMSAEGLQAAVADAGAFSRIAPEHKLAIVQALQARGDVVAMIGDGINDAAALKQADVGVAMGGRGTDVAKEAAAIVLQDDRLETIAAAVEEGRVIFDNIRKFVFYLFSCNVGEVFVLCGAGFVGLPLPLAPLQLLWLNLVTDTFPAFALAVEPGDRGVMERPPRDPREAVLSGPFLRSIIFYGLLITSATLIAFIWALNAAPEHAVSVAFTTLALAQIFHLGNARSAGPVLKFTRVTANRHALGAVALTVGLQLAALYVPVMANTLHLEPLQWSHWLVVLPLSLAPAVIGQGRKLMSRAAPGIARDGPSIAY